MTLISVHGELDGLSSARLYRAVQPLFAAAMSRHIALDLCGVTSISSAGLRVFLRLHQEAGDQGWCLCGARGGLRSALKISGLAWLIPIFPDPDSAQRGLLQHGGAGAARHEP